MMSLLSLNCNTTSLIQKLKNHANDIFVVILFICRLGGRPVIIEGHLRNKVLLLSGTKIGPHITPSSAGPKYVGTYTNCMNNHDEFLKSFFERELTC